MTNTITLYTTSSSSYTGYLGTASEATNLSPWNGSSGAGPATSAYLVGFMSGEQKAKYFYSSHANSIALPTFATPNVIPPLPGNNVTTLGPPGVNSGQFSWVGCDNTSGLVGPVFSLVGYEVPEFGSTSSTTAIGPTFFMLTYAAGSPDVASPSMFYVDSSVLLITSNFAYAGP